MLYGYRRYAFLRIIKKHAKSLKEIQSICNVIAGGTCNACCGLQSYVNA
jgi:hypothetical protein